MSVPITAIISGVVTLADLAQKAIAAGKAEVTDEEVKAALDGMAASDDRLSAAIKRHEGASE